MKKFLILLILSLSLFSCSDDAKKPNEKVNILPYITDGMSVYEPTFGYGSIMRISFGDETYPPYVKVQFSGMTILIFDKYGELTLSDITFRLQPNKDEYYWSK